MDRINALQKALTIQSVLITSKPNLRYFANFVGSRGYLLVTRKKAIFLTDSRYTEGARKIVPKGMEVVDVERKMAKWEEIVKKYRIKELGIEDNALTLLGFKSLKKVSKGVKFRKTYPLLSIIRETKDTSEIALLIKSQRLNEKTLSHVINRVVHIGVTEEEVAWEIEKFARENGADRLAFHPIVAFGKNSSMPHSKPGKTRLQKGDPILIDMGVVYKGYHSDMSRTFFTATPTKLQREIYEIVLKAQETAIKTLRPKMTGEKADAVARNIIIEAGYGETFGHACGHGIGYEIHETPSLAEGYKKPILADTVITVEPGIYLEGKFGVRIEDMIVVREKGPRNLTNYPKTLKEVTIILG